MVKKECVLFVAKFESFATTYSAFKSIGRHKVIIIIMYGKVK